MSASLEQRVSSQGESVEQEPVTTISSLITDLRCGVGKTDGFRSGKTSTPAGIGALEVVFENGGQRYSFLYKKVVEKVEGVIVTSDTEGNIKPGNGKSDKVKSEIRLTKLGESGNPPIEISLTATTITRRTVTDIGTPTTSCLENETGSLTIVKNGRKRVVHDPDKAKRALTQLFPDFMPKVVSKTVVKQRTG